MTALNILIYPGDHLKVITFLFIKNTYIRMYYLRSRHFHKCGVVLTEKMLAQRWESFC